MATESVGGVSYSVDVDLGELNQLESEVDQSTKEMAKDFEGLDKAIGKSTTGINSKVSKTSSSVSNALGGIGRQAGQVGIQVSQLTGQIQGGTNAFIALSQQAADIGFVLGVPLLGAVVSLASAIGFTLVNSLNDAKEAGKTLPDELTKRLDEIKKGFQETDKESRRAFAQVELGKLNTELNAITNRINTLKSAQQTYFQLATKGSDAARNDYKRVGDEIAELEKKLGPLATLQEKVRLETLGIDQDWKSTGDEVDKSATAAERFLSQIELSTTKLNEGEEAALRLAAAQAIGLKAGEELPKNIEDAISNYIEAKNQAAEEAEFRKEIAAEQREALADIEKERDAAHQQELKRLREQDAERKRLESAASGTSGLTSLQALQQRYEQEKQLLLDAQAAGIASKISYEERLTELSRQYGEQRSELLKKETDSATINFESLGNRAAGALASIAVGAQTGKDAIRGLSISIAQEAIGALIRLAVQSAAIKTAETTAGVTQAATLTAAYAPAAAAVSVATGGGAAISGATLALSAIGAITGALLLGGGRLYGGPVSPGKLYPITENGKPEILQQGSNSYLLPGSRGGNVVSNNDMQQMGGGSANITVEVNNYGNDKVQVERGQSGSGLGAQDVIRIIVGDIKNRGGVHSAITQTTTAGNKTT